MNLAGQQSAGTGARSFPWLLSAGLSLLATASGQAQLNYLSDNRSVSATASISPSIAWNGQVLSYSGDYSATATPGAPFADFSGHTSSGNVAMDYQVNVAAPGSSPYYLHSSSSVWVDASQSSFLHAGELSFSSFESGPYHLDPGASAHGAASLLVSFSVSSPTAFNLSCLGTGDPLSSWSEYSLSSANDGVLFSGDTGTMLQEQQYGVPISFSGVFLPGDVYTLDLSSSGFGVGGGLVTDLAVVPEPSSLAIAGAGLALLCARKARRGSARREPVA